MIKVTKENLAEVLSMLYKSEIDTWFGWVYDGGIDYCFKNSPYPLQEAASPEEVKHTDCGDNVIAGFQEIVDDAVESFPTSAFANWIKTGVSKVIEAKEEV